MIYRATAHNEDWTVTINTFADAENAKIWALRNSELEFVDFVTVEVVNTITVVGIYKKGRLVRC